jgi:hypothetical protein
MNEGLVKQCGSATQIIPRHHTPSCKRFWVPIEIANVGDLPWLHVKLDKRGWPVRFLIDESQFEA